MATNNIRNKLFDNAVDLADEDGYIDEVDLTVQPWNRTTVADGQWLNDHAIKPLSSRDLFLADCIDAANLQIETISANLASIGVGGDGSGSSGTNGIVAGKLGRSNATFSDNSDNMSEKSVARVPGGLADTVQPAYSLQYFGFGPKARGAENLTDSITITQGKNAIIQANMHTGIASQIALTPSGMYYRGIEDLSPSEYVVRYPKDFLQVMMSPVLTTDTSGIITYSSGTNTFNIVGLPDATTAVTGVSGSHLKLTENKVHFASAFANDQLYFVCESGFKEYTAPQPQLKTSGGLTVTQGELQLAIPNQNGMFAFDYNKNDGTIVPKLFALPTYDTAYDCSLTVNELGNWVVNRGEYLTLDTDKKLTIDVPTLANDMKLNLNIPSFATTAAIQPTATNSNVYELKYASGHFQTTGKVFQLKLKNGGGIISDGGLCLSLSGLSAFSADEVNSFTDNGYIAAMGGTITPFITVKDPDDTNPNQGRLGVNVNFLRYGFAVSSNGLSLDAVLAGLESRIASLEGNS